MPCTVHSNVFVKISKLKSKLFACNHQSKIDSTEGDRCFWDIGSQKQVYILWQAFVNETVCCFPTGWLLGWASFALDTSFHSFPLVLLKGAVCTLLPEEASSFRKKIVQCNFLYLIVPCLAGVVSPKGPLQVIERGRHLWREIYSTLLSSVSQHVTLNNMREVQMYQQSYKENNSVFSSRAFCIRWPWQSRMNPFLKDSAQSMASCA